MTLPAHPLTAARLRAGYGSIPKLAKKLTISQGQVYNLEAGKTAEPTGATLVELAEVFGVDAVQLLEEIRAWNAARLAKESRA